MNEKNLKLFEKRLLENRENLLKQLSHHEDGVMKHSQRESSGDLSAYAYHPADLGTDSMEREKAFYFASAEGRMLQEIDEALRRLHRGEYGLCESCGKEIGRERLEAVPHARQCIECQSREEEDRPTRSKLTASIDETSDSGEDEES